MAASPERFVQEPDTNAGHWPSGRALTDLGQLAAVYADIDARDPDDEYRHGSAARFDEDLSEDEAIDLDQEAVHLEGTRPSAGSRSARAGFVRALQDVWEAGERFGTDENGDAS